MYKGIWYLTMNNKINSVYFKGKLIKFGPILSLESIKKIKVHNHKILSAFNLIVYNWVGEKNKDKEFLLLSLDDKIGIILTNNKNEQVGIAHEFGEYKFGEVRWLPINDKVFNGGDSCWERVGKEVEDQIIDEIIGN